ncbi:hypothetical protein [Thermococcus sp. MAR1]|uniref:hypothetical protein n=1 Tax=Thermococcus sp. MAR1 TaxID=1638263 RepID=UPI00143AA510|nr:hypothetical protein [Thermococcus sp. MAR1]NJE11221.1 hypothetical protein [Thermococcus sp. MAR1]
MRTMASEGIFGFLIPWFAGGLLLLEDYFNPSWFFRKRICLGIANLKWSLRCHDFFELLFLVLPIAAVALTTWLFRRWKDTDGLPLFVLTVAFGFPGTLTFFLLIATAISKRLPTGIGEEFTLAMFFVYFMTVAGVAAGALAPRHVPVDEEAHDE